MKVQLEILLPFRLQDPHIPTVQWKSLNTKTAGVDPKKQVYYLVVSYDKN